MRGFQPAWKTWAAPASDDTLRSWQAGRCAMCGHDDDRMVRDHCHYTGLIRGLLCSGCNTNEGTSLSDAWDGWRAGDNTANTIGHYEIYKNTLGGTTISPQSALSYYSYAEQGAWFELVVAKLKAGEIQWPEEAPWIPTALERKSIAEAQMCEALDGMFKHIFPPPAAADAEAAS